MFLAICNETLGMSPNEILDSDFALITSILKEYNYIAIQRSKQMNGAEDEDIEEYVNVIDYSTGETKRIKKVKSM